VADDKDEESDEDDSLMALRDQAAKRRKIQKPYEYMAPTSEWSEKGYYGDESVAIKVNQFWIDYLENDIDVFVSGVSYCNEGDKIQPITSYSP
jgi:hypothetical protein